MLTERQEQVLQFLNDYKKAHNNKSPSISKIQENLGVKSRGMVQRILDKLEEQHLIQRRNKPKYDIEILNTQQHNNKLSLPLIGRITAGKPIEAIADPKQIDIEYLLLGDNRFLLEVKGDSMTGDNICDGDWIICEKAETAPGGSIVIVLIDNNETTLKRIFYRNQQIELVPSNDTYQTQRYESERIKIQGIYKGLLRINRSYLG